MMGANTFSQNLNLFLRNIEEKRIDGDTYQRSPFDSTSTITLTTMVNGIRLNKNHLVKVNEESLEVKDDKENNLYLVKDVFYRNRYQSDKKLELIFNAPARQASKIKIKGSLLYFTPTEQNKGKVIIHNFLDSKQNLFKGIDTEIELTLIKDRELIDIQKEMQKKIDKEVEKRKKENGKLTEKEQEEVKLAREWVNDMLRLVNNSSAHTLTFQSNIKIEDAFYSFKIFNVEGKSISTGYNSVDNLYQYHLTEAPTEGCYIQIVREVDTAVRELEFEFKNVVLP